METRITKDNETVKREIFLFICTQSDDGTLFQFDNIEKKQRYEFTVVHIPIILD